MVSLLVVAALLAAGCASRAPLEPGEGSDFERSLNAISAPLVLQDYRVVTAEGQRGVFLKLSRLPDAVEHHSEENPPRVVVEINGPTGTETADEEFPGGDTLISRVRVEQTFGLLRVTLQLQGNEVPPYSVHRMADWVMIRLGS